MALSRPSPKDPLRFARDLEFKIARRIVPLVKRATPSRTLRNAVQFYGRADRKTVIGVPHYWAVYYHDGRRGFGPTPPRRWLVFFPKALADDPRLGGQYAVRFSEWRRLTPEEFHEIVAINRAISGMFSTPDFAIITRSVGPSKGIPFMEDGFKGSAAVAAPIAAKEFSRFVKSYTIRETAVVRARL